MALSAGTVFWSFERVQELLISIRKHAFMIFLLWKMTFLDKTLKPSRSPDILLPRQVFSRCFKSLKDKVISFLGRFHWTNMRRLNSRGFSLKIRIIALLFFVIWQVNRKIYLQKNYYSRRNLRKSLFGEFFFFAGGSTLT